ncbi:hypothetical protein N9Z41_00335 [bacterium]|nr:hypothetical protein [bacterium]
MALKDLQTNLKSLRYGKDTLGGGNSREPYITTSINTAPGDTGGPDFTLRANTLQHVGRDVERLTKFMFSSKGLQFIAKQNLLSRTGVKTQASGVVNEGVYLPTSTLLQAAGNPFGTHLLKQGINPARNTKVNNENPQNLLERITSFSTPLGLPVYTSEDVKSKKTNRLVQLKNEKIAQPSQATPTGFLGNLFGEGLNLLKQTLSKKLPLGQKIKDVSSQLFSNTTGISKYKGEILRYGGGPGSALGIGQTAIKRYTDTSAYDTDEFRKNYYLLNGSLIAGGLQAIDGGAKEDTSKFNTQVVDFRKELLKQQEAGTKKNIISRSLPYTDPNNRIEGRVNLGDPGRRNKNVSSFQKGTGEALDKLNALPIYKSQNVTRNRLKNDLVKFRFGVIQNNNPKNKVFIHFRAFIDSFSDNYSATWNAEKYMGRGENFYRYGGFDRTINLSWTVVAQSKDELIPMYKKLNYLASTLAPDYTSAGYMAGNLVTLTLGGWCYEQPGFITSMNLDVPTESPWEISIPDSVETSKYATGQSIKSDPKVKEMPHMIKVSGFTFTPIHNFVPRVQQNDFDGKGGIEKYGDERFIALENDSLTNSYQDIQQYFDPNRENVAATSTIEPSGIAPLTTAPITADLSNATQGLSNKG